MKWGTRYDYKYVNNLYESINKHTNKTKLICILITKTFMKNINL